MTTPKTTATRILAVTAAVMALAACGGGGSSSDGDRTQTGRLKLSVTDAPVDHAEAVVVQFRAVEFKPMGGDPVRQDLRDAQNNLVPQQINLLPLQDGRAAILVNDVVLPAGQYEWIRLIVDNEPNVRDSYIMIEGNECELRVPSGDESGLKMNRGFTLPADESLALTVDFDLRKSIHAPPGQKSDIPEMPCTQAYQMRPTLRLVQDSEVGAIAGTVDPTLLAAPDCARLVYVFADGANAAGSTVPDDQDAVEPNPVVMAKADALTGGYRASFLPAGRYTVAWTCSADDVQVNEALVFSAPKGATVQANLATTVNFP